MLSFGVASAQTVADNQCDESVASLGDIDKMPMFQGKGVESFSYWVMTNVKYPKKVLKQGIEGTVVVSFVVYPDGKMRDYEVLDTPSIALSDAVIELLESANKLKDGWTPGEVDGKPVKVTFTLPVNFSIMK
jgi:protein TonB